MAIEWKTLSLGKINRSYILYSSKIRGLCLMKWPSENQNQNLSGFFYSKNMSKLERLYKVIPKSINLKYLKSDM